ncbi:MAG TPA: MlaD family protein [Vicinamibacterales bacterium]|nr:MlaD family protein [Vicinamibacterales bacterium]
MATPARLAGVGVFVLTGVGLFAAALFMIGDRQMAFARKYTLYTEFARITGLQPGAIVRVSGAKAGAVRAIEPPADPSKKFRVRLEISADLRQLVRTDSIASIETEGLVGGSFLNVSTGSVAAPEAPPGSTIPGREPIIIADLVEQMRDTITLVNATITSLSAQIQDVLDTVGTTVTSANTLIAEVGDDVKALAAASARISADASKILAGVENGDGTLGKLVKDDELYQRVTAIAKNAEAVSIDTREAVLQARKTLENLQAKEGDFVALSANLTKAIDEARAAMNGLAQNMEALKRNFLLRGFFNRRGYFDLDDISPAEYRNGSLTRDSKRRVLRVWLRDAVIFTRLADGREELTGDGKARLDSAITAYLSRLPDGVLMIEGYAQQGSRTDQHLTSRARAAMVRDYLVAKFGLDPEATGIMPLGADSAGSPENAPWDGVALAFFIDRAP